MQYLRWLLFPFSLLYGLVIVIRNWCYDAGIFKSYRAEIPVISVGNLDVGGAGKSPMTEYLIRLFKDRRELATLSRGYGRETKGFVAEDQKSKIKAQKKEPSTFNLQLSTKIGDEPAQFATKFPDITVAVCEDRVFGIKQLQAGHNLVILDDAYQHRAIKPGYSILLFDYNRIDQPHLLLPAGNLREPFGGRERADCIIISKCPEQLSAAEQAKAVKKIKPYPRQHIFFTSITYQPLQKMDGEVTQTVISAGTTVFLLTGIANPRPLVQHLKKTAPQIIHHNYPDHHRFSLKNIAKLAAEFNACASENKLVITTEKDAQRLLERELLPLVQQLPIFMVPIGINFLNGGGPRFDQLMNNYVG